MEVWILLAAAGSGYLARCWQNAQKTKGTSADEADSQDSTAGSSNQLPSARGRYRHFSPSGRWQVGKSLGGKGSHQWGRVSLKDVRVSENAAVGHPSDPKAGERVDSDEGRRESTSEVRVVIIDGKTSDESSTAFHNAVDGGTLGNVAVLPKESSDFNVEHSSSQEDPTTGYEVVARTSSQENKARKVSRRSQASEGKGSGDDCGSLLSRSYSGKRMNDSRNEKGHKGGYLPQDGCSGKRMKDALETKPSQEEITFGGTWMPGFWDVSQGVFVLDPDSFLVQQEGDGRSKGSSTRKIKTPNNRSGRSRGSMCRRKRLTTQKPMSSLESCLSAQLDVNFNQRAGGFLPLFCSPAGDAVEGHVTGVRRNLGDHILGPVASEKVSTEGSLSTLSSAIGLPSLSRQQNRRSSLNIIKKIKSRAARASKGETTGIPFKGLEGTSQDAMLFNFGVGVGIMFTIMSNKHEVKMLNELLREAECLIKDLECELEGRYTSRPECDPTKKSMEDSVEQRQLVLSSTIKKVRSAARSLNSMRLSLTEELEPALGMEHMQPDDMAKLEAELEAELERMELNLDDGRISKHHRQYSGASEFDADIVGNVVQGELTVKGLPCEIEVESEEEDNSDSSHEDLHVSSYAVSPRQLAERLHEVLEARQYERIAELEAELKAVGSRLHAQEEQLQRWKDQSSGLIQGDVGVSNFHQGAHLKNSNEAKESDEASVSLSTEVEKKQCLSSGNLNSPTVSPRVTGDVSSYDMKNAVLKSSSRFQKVSKSRNNPVFITLGGDALAAYNEAYDEFSKALSDSDMGSHAVNNSSLDKHDFSENELQEADLSTAEVCGLELFNSGVSEHWEQVDLLSLAENFYTDAESEFMLNMPSLSKTPSRGRAFPKKSSRKKGTISSHPEPEQSFTGSKAADSSDDTTNDTSGSTPCSVKFMDITVGPCHIDDQMKTEGKIGAESYMSPYFDWSEDILIPAGANTPVVNSQEGKHSLYYGQKSLGIKSLQSPGCLTLEEGDRSMPEDCDYTSDLDEQLGQLLIKRIVEKSRRGSPIIQDAHTVLASFERNETTLDTDCSDSREITAVESVPRENLNVVCAEILSPAAVKKGYLSTNDGVSCQDNSLLCTAESGFLNSISEWDVISTTRDGSESRATSRSIAESSGGSRQDFTCLSAQAVNSFNSIDEGREVGSKTCHKNVYDNDRQRESQSEIESVRGSGRTGRMHCVL